MIYIVLFISIFVFSCCGSGYSVSGSADNDYGETEGNVENLCEESSVTYRTAILPENISVNPPGVYNKNHTCVPLPEPENGELVLDEGCFEGCLKVGEKLSVSGKGPENTMIICKNMESEAVVEVLQNAGLNLENLSLSGFTRCVTGENGSNVKIKNVNISHCLKGGINICLAESGCRASLSVSDSFIGDIDEAASGISYGISFGNGKLNVSGSVISGVNSFGIAVWGETGESNNINIENSVISGVYGGLRSYEGHGFYAENSADIVIKGSSISDTATSFIFVTSESGEIKLQLIDFNVQNTLETNEEQGGIVLDGKVNAYFDRVSIENSRGNGIFSRDALLYAENLTIKSVFSDGNGDNGFALQLVDGSESFIKNLSVVSAEKVGIILDGKCSADIEDFEILSTKSDRYSGEYGVGAAVQEGASLTMKNGVVADNREAGFLVLDSEISLENVEIKETKSRGCMENRTCIFAPDTDFAHGISLYSSSVMRFDSVTLSKNNNGLNVEDSEVIASGSKRIYFNRNVTAVNAWDIDDFSKLEENLENSSFCGNESVFTADLQPVRDDL